MADNLLNRNSIRLLREAWSTPAALAQELFMIASDEPVDQARPRTPQVQARIERAAANAPPQPAARQAAIVRPPQPSLGDQMRQRIAAASAFTFPSAPTNSSASVPGGGPVDLGLPRNGGTAVAPIAYASQWTGGVPGNPRRPTQQPGVQASQTGQPGRSADASTSPPRERVSSPQPAPPAFPGSVRGEEPPAMAGQARERSEPAPVQSAATPVAARALDVPSQGTRVPVRAVDRADPFSVRTASGFVNLRSGQIAVTRPRRSAPPAPTAHQATPCQRLPTQRSIIRRLIRTTRTNHSAWRERTQAWSGWLATTCLTTTRQSNATIATRSPGSITTFASTRPTGIARARAVAVAGLRRTSASLLMIPVV